MKLVVVLLLLLAGCASGDQFAPPFAFVGLPERVDDRVVQTIDGRERSVVIRILRVTKGRYESGEIRFGFREHEEAPLVIGRTYLFEAYHTRHGIYYSKWTPLPQTPNKAPEPTPGPVTDHASACSAPVPVVAHL